MDVLAWLLPGVVLGWAAAVVLRRESHIGLLASVVVGGIGAGCGSLLLAPALGVAAADLPMALLGAILLLAATNLLVPGGQRATATARPRQRTTAATTTGEQPARG